MKSTNHGDSVTFFTDQFVNDSVSEPIVKYNQIKKGIDQKQFKIALKIN